MNSKCLLLFLLVIDVTSLGGPCPKLCICSDKNGKSRVDCRNKGLTEVLPYNEFPSHMQVLDLSRNNISVIRGGFLEFHIQLERLYLHKNSIRILEERAFVGLSNLNRLLLNRNKLVKIKAKTFIGLPNLDLLNISVNKIRDIDKLAFFGLKNLTRLILSNNSFKSIENGTFNSLKKLRKIDIKHVPLLCDCRLNPFIQYITESSIKKVFGSCFGNPATKFSALRDTNLCATPAKLSIFPKTNQVVAVGDGFRLVCNTTHKQYLNLEWTKNNKRVTKTPTVFPSKQIWKGQQKVSIDFLSLTHNDGGEYSCESNTEGTEPIKVNINVVSPMSKMCARDLVKTTRGNLVWPVTLARTTAAISCPLLVNDNKHDINRTCNQDGVWGNINFGNCPLISLLQRLTELKNLLEQENFKDITGFLATLKALTEPSNFQIPQDVSLVLSLMDGVDRKHGSKSFSGKALDNILEIFNNMMDIDKEILYEAERRDQSSSRLAARLELISRRIISKRLSRVFSNIVIGSVQLEKHSEFNGKTCNVFFNSRNPSLPNGVLCKSQRRKEKTAKKVALIYDLLVSIHIPKTIFENLVTIGYNKKILEVQFLIYRNARLFPNIVSNKTTKLIKERNISSSVLAIQMDSIKELNLSQPVVITFTTKAGKHPLISHFDFIKKDVGMTWSPNSDCHVNRSTSRTTTIDCVRLVNKNLAVMSVLGNESSLEYSVEIVVYFGAIIASLFLFATLFTFAVFRNLRFNRDDAAMLMNVCLSLMVVVITFAFGIDGTHNNLMCLVVGILLHFFFLASLLWLGSYVVCVSRCLKPPKESEEEFTPVLRYYMISWGVPAIICGITLAGDLKNYKDSDYCWLTESAGLGAFVGPACLLFIINSVLLVRLHLLLARGSNDRRHSDENPEETRLQADEPGVLEPCPDPDSDVLAEKSTMTINLVATWVVMSLIYVNFIVAYLLVKSRHAAFTWKIVSYVYALANIALGVSVYLFHCVMREVVREAWKKAWKTASAKKINWWRWRTLWITRNREGNGEQEHANGRILLNGEDMHLTTGKSESDRQSNITLPSSAALTNDVFINGRPLSTARVSLLDEADFPSEENTPVGANVNAVDITEVDSDGGHPRSQASVHSGRGSAATVNPQVVPKTTENIVENGNLISSETQHENHSDITDGVTSRSESSAPTAIEASLPKTSTPLNVTERPKTFSKRPSYVETAASPSSSSLSEAPVRAHNFPGKKSSESLNSRNGSVGTRLRRLQHNQQPTYVPSGSSTFSEIAPKDHDTPKGRQSSESVNTRGTPRNAGGIRQPTSTPSILGETTPKDPDTPKGHHSSESVNTRGTPRNAGASTQRTRNRYKDGREKPEPKQWSGNLGPRIAYVAVPHVSRIHREPTHNETSV